ncbi:MAG: cytochrome P450 [Pseudonocardiaceae bacterium]
MTQPGSTHPEPVLLNILDPQFSCSSPEVRAAAQAAWWARTPVGLAVLRYRECVALLRDRRLRHGSRDMLTARGVTSGPFAQWLSTMLLNLEGEPHQRLRRLVSTAFTQRRVDALRPFMRSVTHELIDDFAATGRCEFMADFADPYPARVIAELLGIPDDEFDAFLGWANDMGLGFSPAAATELDRIEAALAELYECCDRLVSRRRVDPGDDLISALITAADDGGKLTGEELRILVSTLVFAGQDTTRNQLGMALATFTEHPQQWQLLAEHPELAGTAVEEVMRVSPTTPVIGRVATEDFTFQDVNIPAGTHIGLFVAVANTEPETFGDAPFDITAKRTAQLTFGGGIHYCLGTWLARIEMQEALPILAARLPDLATAGPVGWRPPIGITGPTTLPLRWTT